MSGQKRTAEKDMMGTPLAKSPVKRTTHSSTKGHGAVAKTNVSADEVRSEVETSEVIKDMEGVEKLVEVAEVLDGDVAALHESSKEMSGSSQTSRSRKPTRC